MLIELFNHGQSAGLMPADCDICSAELCNLKWKKREQLEWSDYLNIAKSKINIIVNLCVDYNDSSGSALELFFMRDSLNIDKKGEELCVRFGGMIVLS